MYPANPFGDIVIPHEEGIVVNDVEGAEGFDMQQDAFTGDDGIGSGDDGLGYLQAQRMKRRMLASGRQMNVVQPAYAVMADREYDTGFGGFSFKRLFTPPKALRKFQLGRFLGKTVAPIAAGGLPGLFLSRTLFKKKTGMTTAPAPSDQIVAPVGGPVPPAPAPGPTTDVIGQPAPFFPSTPSPIPSGAGSSATEDVAAAAQSSGAGMEQAGMFGGMDPKMLMLAAGIGLALFAFSRGGGRRRR